jgi:hypothetical protein
MFQPRGDFGLEKKPRSRLGVVRIPAPELLQRHLAVEFLIISAT